jgi:hypothetical protein
MVDENSGKPSRRILKTSVKGASFERISPRSEHSFFKYPWSAVCARSTAFFGPLDASKSSASFNASKTTSLVFSITGELTSLPASRASAIFRSSSYTFLCFLPFSSIGCSGGGMNSKVPRMIFACSCGFASFSICIKAVRWCAYVRDMRERRHPGRRIRGRTCHACCKRSVGRQKSRTITQACFRKCISATMSPSPISIPLTL